MININKHKWSDNDIQGVSIKANHIVIESLSRDHTINKADVKVLAKHFGLLKPKAKSKAVKTNA